MREHYDDASGGDGPTRWVHDFVDCSEQEAMLIRAAPDLLRCADAFLLSESEEDKKALERAVGQASGTYVCKACVAAGSDGTRSNPNCNSCRHQAMYESEAMEQAGLLVFNSMRSLIVIREKLKALSCAAAVQASSIDTCVNTLADIFGDTWARQEVLKSASRQAVEIASRPVAD